MVNDVRATTINDTREFIISNLHRDEVNDTNNDITISLPDGIFSGKVEAVNLKHLYIDYDYETIGTSNYQLYIAYPSTAAPVSITINLSYYTATIIKTDLDIANALATAINDTLATTVFSVFFNNAPISNANIYRDNSNLLSNYTIFTTNGVDFELDFSSKTSIGPLIGFGNNIYSGSNSYTGGNTPPAGSYESIYVSNAAYNTVLKLYDQPTDINCKMDLYDGNGVLIPNYLDDRDATISIPIIDGYIKSIGELIGYLEVELNRYSTNFNGAVFVVSFDYSTYKFTISNDKNHMFGIGFRFDRGDGKNNYGSMHKILGFSKRVYTNATSLTSIRQANIFDKSYIPEYIMIYSDLIKHNFDTKVIVSGSNNSYSMYESIFTIPISSIDNYEFRPINKIDYRVRINASKLAKLYNEKINKQKTINFYLRLASGRHIKLNTQWAIQLEIEYSN